MEPSVGGAADVWLRFVGTWFLFLLFITWPPPTV
jgi:hypothetical protein